MTATTPPEPTTIRVVIVDDSGVVRRLVKRALEADPTIEVVGTAPDGRAGVDLVREVDPDVVTLDIEMPVMDGLDALAEIRRTHPRLPVIMFSTLTERAASATLDALSLGASDYVTKPSHTHGLDDAVDHLRAELLPRVQALAARARSRAAPTPTSSTTGSATARLFTSAAPAPATAPARRRPAAAGPPATTRSPPAHGPPVPAAPAAPARSARSVSPATTPAPAPAPATPRPSPARPTTAGTARAVGSGAPAGVGATAVRPTIPARPRPAPAGRVKVVAIGVSTGGPNALNDVIPELPGDLAVPVLIVQHMPPLFTQILAERLNVRSPLTVIEAAHGDVVEPGGVWVAPGGHHMVVRREGHRVRIAINDEPPENSCRPAVDPMLRSVADVYGAGTLTVILTGMGQDGLRGSELVHEIGGQVLAQDEATSVVWGMPGHVVKSGVADDVLPLEKVASEVVRLVSGGRPRAGAGAGSSPSTRRQPGR